MSLVLQVEGLVFAPDLSQVLMLEKAKPVQLQGLWTFPGGHVEAGESPLDAIRREVMEECGIWVQDWVLLEEIQGLAGPLFVFYATSTKLADARTCTIEPVKVWNPSTLADHAALLAPHVLRWAQEAQAKLS